MDDLENCPTLTGPYALTIEVICYKLNHWSEKNKSKGEEKNSKEKAFAAYNKQFKGRCFHKWSQIGHKFIDQKWPINKNEDRANNDSN